MAVRIEIKQTAETVLGKFAVVEPETVSLFSGIMVDKKGGFRGCGKKRIFEARAVEVTADEPLREMKEVS